MKTVIRNIHTLVTCDDSDRVLHNTDLVMENGVFASVGEPADSDGADFVLDGSKWIIYPGLINTHHHLYQYFTRNTDAQPAWTIIMCFLPNAAI